MFSAKAKFQSRMYNHSPTRRVVFKLLEGSLTLVDAEGEVGWKWRMRTNAVESEEDATAERDRFQLRGRQWLATQLGDFRCLPRPYY